LLAFSGLEVNKKKKLNSLNDEPYSDYHIVNTRGGLIFQ
jgi:hypothetical protein